MASARLRRTKAQWEVLVEEWRSSGVSRRAFAERRGLNLYLLTRWIAKLTRSEDVGPAFAEVVVSAKAMPAWLRIEVPMREVVVCVPPDFDALALRRLLDVLCG